MGYIYPSQLQAGATSRAESTPVINTESNRNDIIHSKPEKMNVAKVFIAFDSKLVLQSSGNSRKYPNKQLIKS